MPTSIVTPLSLMQLASQWQQEQASNPGPLTKEKVFEIAFRCVLHGIQPTQQAIIQINGAGSPNTVHPLLREFFVSGELSRRWSAPKPVEGVPEALLALWEPVLSEARLQAARDLAAEKDAIADQNQGMAEWDVKLQTRERLLDERAQALDELVPTLKSELGLAHAKHEGAVAAWQQERQVLCEKNQLANDTIDELNERLQKAETQTTFLIGVRDDLEAKLQAAIESTQSLMAEQAQLVSTHASLQASLADTGQQLRQNQAALQTANEALHGTREDADKRVTEIKAAFHSMELQYRTQREEEKATVKALKEAHRHDIVDLQNQLTKAEARFDNLVAQLPTRTPEKKSPKPPTFKDKK